MNILTLYKGIIIGISVAAPVGPISILCIRRSLAESRSSGFATALGAALADGIYGAIAGFGLTAISSFLISHHNALRFVGGIFLAFLGLKIFFAKPVSDCKMVTNKSFVTTLIQTLLLTLTNPFTIIAFAGIFASIGIGTEDTDYISATLISLGVFLGSAIWFIALSTIVSLFRKKITNQTLIFFNKISGIIIISVGIFSLLSLLKL